MNTYFNCHNHTTYSNLRLLDATNKPDKLIDTAIELGLSGIAITDHEALCSHVKVLQHVEKIRERHPDFKVALGNEIYLTDNRERGQKYFHFILIAKDAIGHKQLRELSSTAWYNAYSDRGLERVPTLKSELSAVIGSNPGHVIATNACIGGQLASTMLDSIVASSKQNFEEAELYRQRAELFLQWCLDLFGGDFFIECAPSTMKDQVAVNYELFKLSRKTGVPIICATDSHYYTSKDRWAHKAFLNSKGGEREVDAFYEFARLMDYNECHDLLLNGFAKYEPTNAEMIADGIMNNTLLMQKKIEDYTLFHKQSIPMVDVPNYAKTDVGVNNPYADDMKAYYPTLLSLFNSDDKFERYWINQCWNKLNELGKGIGDTYEYLDELEEEAKTKKVVGKALDTNIFRYPITLQHYIDLIWDCGSLVGAGRGSSCAGLNHYLLGITQLDPIKWKLPWYRYMNDARVDELPDIDIDISPSKRPLVLQKIREEREHLFMPNLPEWAKKELGCTMIATFGTCTSKNSILIACRGYRSEDYPEGIDVDEAQFLSSFVPVERGFTWPLSDMVNGNVEKNRKPLTAFLKEINKYPGLLDIALSIEGQVVQRGSHASGVIMFEDDPFDRMAFMRAPNGDIETQYDLHQSEWCGCTKFDFLVTDVQDKIIEAIRLLQEDGQIEPELSLREVYNKYLHPDVLPLDDEQCWKALANNEVLNCFQFNTPVGSQTAKILKPQTILEMTNANALMRLMGEEGEERPLDKYKRFKDNIQLWYKEMERNGLSAEEQKALEPHFLKSYGVPVSQEQLMQILMDKSITGFTLAEANKARSIVGKKKMDKIPELQQKVYKQATSEALGKYVWKYGLGPQMGYSFSEIHSLAYSFIGFQTLFLATHWNPTYWNTACMIVDSGSMDAESGNSTDYSKMARALGATLDAGIKVSLPDINHSDFGFKPDVDNNRILYGLKAISNVGDELIQKIIENRPYQSTKDFYYRVRPNKQAMIALIKGGAFDDLEDRKFAMGWYIWETCDKKQRLTLQNMSGLIQYGLLPEETDEQIMTRRVYEFNRYLKTMRKSNYPTPNCYSIDDRSLNFLTELGQEGLIKQDSIDYMEAKAWDKIYQNWMDVFRHWIADNKEEILFRLNSLIFKEAWNKYALGSYSSWEMEALCFYYHTHELAHVNRDKYGIVNFFNLPAEPMVERTFQKGGKENHMFYLNRICGTCIAKNKTKGTVSLLTPEGVVEVKFRKEYFALFDRRISQKQPDGSKKIIEKSFFDRGSMIVVLGFRSDDNFIAKKYNSMGPNIHQLYKIDKVTPDGNLILRNERAKGEEEDAG